MTRPRLPSHPVASAAGAMFLAGVLSIAFSAAAALADDAGPLVGEGERLLILSPHPDDETLGAAGLAQRVLAHGGNVRTVILTAGDGFVNALQQRTGQQHPEPDAFLAYGQERIHEARQVAQLLGGGKVRLDVLGFPDGNLLPLLFTHWESTRPGRSDTTLRHTVPYREAVEQYLPYAGSNVRLEIVNVMRDMKPTMIAFTDLLDEHPDHRAAGLFALMAIADYMRTRTSSWPKLLAYLVHWHSWPPDSGELELARKRTGEALQLPNDLPERGQTRSCLTLTDEELARKQAALVAYRTQQEVMPAFMSAFVRRTECFSVNVPEDAVSLGVGIRRQVRDLSAKLARATSP